jgi:hypothetical protein
MPDRIGAVSGATWSVTFCCPLPITFDPWLRLGEIVGSS